MAIVYQHKRLDNNAVFYIGIGVSIRRAYRKDGRSNYWQSIVRKAGYCVDILLDDVSWEEASSWEKYLIEIHGRSDINAGHLCNMTDGGDGMVNPSESIRAKIATGKKGKPTSLETRAKQSESKLGSKNVRSKKVIDTVTGKVYESVMNASCVLSINHSTLSRWLSGYTPNKSSLEYLKTN